jgi:SAM-dependent methyltransferase
LPTKSCFFWRRLPTTDFAIALQQRERLLRWSGDSKQRDGRSMLTISNEALIRILGWRAAILHGDPCVLDRWKWLRDRLQPGPLRTLDAGCGSGAFAMYAAKIGNQSLGLSFDERNNQVATRRAKLLGLSNVRFSHIDLRELDKHADALGVFDQIICTEVIEHILDDRKLLTGLSSMLKAGGRLLLTAPYKHANLLLGDKLSLVEDGGHVRLGYTHEELQQMFSDCALELVDKEYLSGFISQRLVNLSRRLRSLSAQLRWAVTFPLRIFQLVDHAVTGLMGYPFSTVAVVGLKNGMAAPTAAVSERS